ncbi:MAG: PilZ domain-containing protein [Treponema sp.]|nr:PilZ domain-containing protein [Treponema sp.]
MSLIVILIIAALVILAAGKIYSLYKVRIDFFFRGTDEGFSGNEINLLWNVSQACGLEEPISLYYSLPSLSRCISHIKTKAENEGEINNSKTQHMLSKLYEFRNKIEKNADKKRGLESSRSLSDHQKLRIILPGKGVFSSEIMNNGKLMTIRVPTQKGQITIEGKKWIGESVSVYLWRVGDARYVFDTKVVGEGVFLGKACINLEQSNNLVRTQKRNAIRAKCHILANLYILKEKVVNYNEISSQPGLKCLLEDISENGAMIRIGGKGLANIQIRLQFQLDSRLVVMFGIVRTVEYNAELKQSRLHFECVHIEPVMKNIVLSYVFNILPEKEKEIYEALSLTDTDEEKTDTTENKTDKSEENLSPAERLDGKISDTDDLFIEKEAKAEEMSPEDLKEIEELKVSELPEINNEVKI